MSELQKKLNALMEKYDVSAEAELRDDLSSVCVGGKEIPLLPHRNERRLVELKKIASDTVGRLSHFKTMSLNPKTESLESVIRRELDTVEFVSGQRITEVFAVGQERACTILCRLEDFAVATLELACTLPAGAEAVDKHELITDRGTACDRAVDSQTPLSSVYVYGEKHEEFTDVDFELYGLSIREISAVRQAFGVCADKDLAETLLAADARLGKLLDAVAQSEKTCANVKL